MGLLELLAETIVSADKLNDNGVPSISIATNIDSLQSHVITNGPEDSDTVYQACSISKAITALAVARLIDQSIVSYETKIVEHVPQEIVSAIVEPATTHLINHVTIGHLLSHRAGLSQHGFPGYEGEPPSMRTVFQGHAPANTPRIRFLSFPGSQTCYSGGGYCLLQLALEHITRKPFAELMQEIVLKPLDMHRSHYGDLSAREENYAKAHATAYQVGSVNARGYFQFAELAAAGLWTTPSDLLKAAAAIQDSLKGTEGFLKKETAQNMLTTLQPNSPLNMAYGWSVDRLFFAHAGDNDPGYQTYLLAAHDGLFDELSGAGDVRPAGMRGVRIAFMTNSQYGFEAIQKCMAAIFFLQNWPRPASLPSTFGSMTGFVPYAAFDDHEDGRGAEGHFLGHWSNGWTIAQGAGGLQVRFEGIAEPLRLRAAASPASSLTDDGSIVEDPIYVVDGLAIAVRSLCEDRRRHLEVLQDEKQLLTRIE